MRSIPLGLLALVTVIGLALALQKELPPALASLVAAERAFAATSVEKGVREAFLAFFADDGINFQPHPVNTQAAFRKQPAPATRPPVTLSWEPIYADVSAAGDLGYTTGPYVNTDQSPQPKPPRHGYYFSVWKVQAGGTWKVVLDFGIQTPAPSSPSPPLRTAPPAAVARTRFDVEAERSRLLELDKAAGGFLELLEDGARLYRDGVFPVIGKAAIRAFVADDPTVSARKPIKADVARSGDLGYTYGSYDAAGEKGYFAHVWKRGGDGRWRLTFEVARALPPG